VTTTNPPTEPTEPTEPLLCWSQERGYYEQPMPPELVWRDGEEVFERFLRLGYERNHWVGDERAECVRVYRREYSADGGDLPAYVFVISDYESYEEIAVWSRADMMALRDTHFARFAAAPSDDVEKLRVMAERAFQAWHGHSSDKLCPRCDPEKWDMIQKATLERELRDAKGRAQKHRGKA